MTILTLNKKELEKKVGKIDSKMEELITMMGTPIEEIKEAVKKIENPKHALHIYNYGQAIIIDDTYNSNPDGFRVAINMLAGYSHEYTRIVITRGIIELGELSDDIHEQIGGEVAFVADELVITAPDFIEPLKKGVGTKYNTKVMVKLNSKDLLEFIKNQKEKKSVILLENRIPDIVRQELAK